MLKVGKESVFLVSLGCAKNLVDSELMLGILRDAGFKICSDPLDAGVAVINTCGFIESAVEEALDAILDFARMKRPEGNLERLVVTGCLVQRYGYKLKREIPEVDAWLGTSELHRIAEMVRTPADHDDSAFYISRPSRIFCSDIKRARSTPFYTAYLKIAEGCSHRCTYCTIPAIRGQFRSRTIQSLVSEAEMLRDEGVKEINLIAQDTTMYGSDLKGPCLADLLEKLVAVGGIPWIRILYSNPAGVSDRLLDLMDSEERICPYIDIPVQHVNSSILRAMGRHYDRGMLIDLISRIRSRRRKIALRTTVMVGFPGETEENFLELRKFIGEVRFDYLGAFAYSPEKGTASERIPTKVSPAVAESRLREIMSMQARISKEINSQLLGRSLKVLVEGTSDDTDLLLKGRTAAMAPDVDVQVLINSGTARVGEFASVLITEAHTYDLIGEVVQEC